MKKKVQNSRDDRQPAAVHPGEAVLDHKVLDGAQASRRGVDGPDGAEVEAAFEEKFLKFLKFFFSNEKKVSFFLSLF